MCAENLGPSQIDMGFIVSTEILGLVATMYITFYMSNSETRNCLDIEISSASTGYLLIHDSLGYDLLGSITIDNLFIGSSVGVSFTSLTIGSSLSGLINLLVSPPEMIL